MRRVFRVPSAALEGQVSALCEVLRALNPSRRKENFSRRLLPLSGEMEAHRPALAKETDSVASLCDGYGYFCPRRAQYGSYGVVGFNSTSGARRVF